MDPLSVAASITGIVSVCLQAGGSLDTLRGRFQNAHLTITALTSQCRAIKTGLSELQTMVLQNHTIRERPDIIAAIDTTLTGCMVVLSCFENTLDRLHGDETGRSRSLGSLISRWRNKARIMWNEDEMKGYISLLQGQQSALSFLVQVLHMESIDEILEKIRNGRGFLDKQAIKAESLRQSNPQVHVTESVLGLSRSADTIFGDGTSVIDDQEFDFDNIVINSKSYRRAMAMAKEVVLNRRKATPTSTSGSRQSNMSPGTSIFDTSAELQSTELDSLETIPAVPRGMQNVPSPSGTSGTPHPAVPDNSFETIQDDKTRDDKNKDTGLDILDARRPADPKSQAPSASLQPRSDRKLLPPKTINMRADELSRLLQLLRFSRVSHQERLDVIQEKEKEIVDMGSVAAAKITGKYAFLDQQRASAPNVYQSPYNMPSGLSKYARTTYGLIPSADDAPRVSLADDFFAILSPEDQEKVKKACGRLVQRRIEPSASGS